ncbi:unnamed protein product, partial [Symbiodinium necroappetens]
DGRLDPEPWQGNYPASVPVGKGFPKPGTPGNDWRREWRGEEPSRLKSAEEHWNPRSLNGSSKGKGKGKKGGKDARLGLGAIVFGTDESRGLCAQCEESEGDDSPTLFSDLGPEAHGIFSGRRGDCACLTGKVSVVGRTAFMVAAERALETDLGKDALFSDPFAKVLAGKDGREMSDKLGEAAAQFGFENWPEFHKVWTVVRTKFIDDIIGILTDQKQMVNLGAGVGYSKLKASYEVDTPEVKGENRLKQALMDQLLNAVKTAVFERLGATPFCPVVTVSADFRVAGELARNLARSGFDEQAQFQPSGVASVFLIEGVLDFLEDAATPFLSEAARSGYSATATQVSKMAAPGSLAVINYAIGPP